MDGKLNYKNALTRISFLDILEETVIVKQTALIVSVQMLARGSSMNQSRLETKDFN
jgi:hypothetical protein